MGDVNHESRLKSPTQYGVFLTTRWSVVLSAHDDRPGPAAAALEELCRSYWRPLYAFARRQGQTPAAAEDSTQAFFLRLLSREDISRADPARGRFRTFLLTSFKNFLSNQRRDAQRLKRGGGEGVLPMDFADAESSLHGMTSDQWTPDQAFDRQWAERLLELAGSRLREQYEASGKLETFERLSPYLWAQQEGEDMSGLARELGISPGAARVALHRARTRLRQLIRAEIAQTVEREEDVDDELRNLVAAMRGA